MSRKNGCVYPDYFTETIVAGVLFYRLAIWRFIGSYFGVSKCFLVGILASNANLSEVQNELPETVFKQTRDCFGICFDTYLVIFIVD